MPNNEKLVESIRELNERRIDCGAKKLNAYASFLFTSVHALATKCGDDAIYAAFCGGNSIKATHQCYEYAQLLDTDPPAIFNQLPLSVVCEELIGRLFPIVVEKFVFDYSIEKYPSIPNCVDYRPLELFKELLDELGLNRSSPLDVREIVETYCQTQGNNYGT